MFPTWLSKTVMMMALALLCGAIPARAQYKSYSDYYQTNRTATPTASLSVNRYLYDKYFYHRPTVSPYLSAEVLGGTQFGTAYTTTVLPEIQRREASLRSQAQYVQQRKLQGNVGHTAFPGAGFSGATIGDAYLKPVQPGRTTPSHYHNHWYGGWNNR
jgi:hypothetical protein